jgi:hypothetical protein
MGALVPCEVVGEDGRSLDDLLALGSRAATAYGRADLADRIAAVRARVTQPTATVLVVGEFKAGKSSLVNALVGADVCPVDDDVATAVLTSVRHNLEPAAAIVTLDDGRPRTDLVDPAVARSLVLERADATRPVVRVDLGVPSPLLRRGIVLVDTPGAGGLGGPRSAQTMTAASVADAVVFVTAATQEMTATELAYLTHVHALCDTLAIVETKTDLRRDWRTLTDLDRSHVAAAGVDAELIGVSSLILRIATASDDDVLGEESGIGPLSDWLADVAAGHRDRAEHAAVALLTGAVGQLQDQLRAERAALAADDGATALVDGIARAEQETARAKHATAKWNQRLTDELADVTRAVERDVRERVRALLADADAAIDAIDPARGWDAVERGLYEATAIAAAGHVRLRHERLLDAVVAVTALFDDEGGGDDLLAPLAGAALPLASTIALDTTSTNLLNQCLTLLRASYGGVAMLGFLGGFAGVAVAAPVMAGLGLVLGGKGLKDERERQVAQRRAQAKAAVRKYLDDIAYTAANESRDTIRQVQRHLRDHFAERAADRQRTAAAALAAATAAMELETSARRRRLADVDAELERLDRLEALVRDAREGAPQ